MKRYLTFISGVIVGALMFVATISFAATGVKNVEVKYANIKLVVDGGLVKSEQEPFILDGRTYVPLRVVAEALGNEVGWEDNTVVIGKGKHGLLLTELVPPTTTGLKLSSEPGINVDGKSYPRGFHITGYDRYDQGNLSFNVLGKGIKQLSGLVAVDDATPDAGQQVQVQIVKDNTKVWEGTLKKGDSPIPVNINIEGANSLYIRFNNSANAKVNFIDFIGKY